MCTKHEKNSLPCCLPLTITQRSMENDKHTNPDDRIRAKLDANELRPDAALWHTIEKELDKTKRRSAFYRKRYLLLLLLLLIGGVGVFVMQQGDGSRFVGSGVESTQTKNNDQTI